MRIICVGPVFADYTIQLANTLSKKETVMLVLFRTSNEHIDAIDKQVNLYLLGRTGRRWYHPANLLILRNIVFFYHLLF